MEVEDAMVLPAYAIVDPRAVMVKPIHTLVAEIAVPRPGTFDDLAETTEGTRVAFV
jgi:hypothetical protein